MATIYLTDADDARTIVNPGSYTIDALAGTDSLSFGTSLRSAYTITKAADGAVRVDTISGASGAFHATLYNTEVLLFDSERDRVDLASLFGGTGTTLMGTAGNDLLTPGSSVTAVDGGGGIDTVSLGLPRGAYQLKAVDGGFSLAAAAGATTLSLSHVERLRFADQQLALDLDGNAGLVAKVLGAVFGPGSVGDPGYVGIGLGHADSGLSAQDLMHLALEARLGPSASAAAVVSLLYGNVVGSGPSAADLAYYTGLLDNKTYTPDTLGMLAADSAQNLVNIDFSGLVSMGLGFS